MSIEDIRGKLIKRRDELERRLHDIARDVRHEDNPLSGDWEEQAVQREHEEVADALGNEARREMDQIKRALTRIDSGEYPYCSECGLEIGHARLDLLPYTNLCVTCAQARETTN